MDMNSIGKNIRKYRISKKLRQADLAEQSGLSTNYIGMVERGEKTPSLESFINIVNALDISADIILANLLRKKYEIKNSLLNEKLEKLPAKEKNKIYDVIDTMLNYNQ